MQNEVKSTSGGRKIIVLEFITLDGVIQAPGGPEEDPSDNFKYGGWIAPYFSKDEVAGEEMAKQMKKTAGLLLGRRTYNIWAGFWPEHVEGWPQVNKITKYVVSKTLKNPTWENTEVIRDIGELKKLKNSNGPDLQVYGSANLVQTLMEYDLVDEFWLKIFPLTLGSGKRLFEKGTIPAAFKLFESKISPSGIIIAYYKRAGEVKTGSIA
jgi:dihydrofolate reductase